MTTPSRSPLAPGWLTASEWRKREGMSRQLLRYHILTGRVPGKKLAGRWYIPAAAKRPDDGRKGKTK